MKEPRLNLGKPPRFIKEQKKLGKNGTGSDPIRLLMTGRKILEPTWKKLLIIKNSKQDFISWRE